MSYQFRPQSLKNKTIEYGWKYQGKGKYTFFLNDMPLVDIVQYNSTWKIEPKITTPDFAGDFNTKMMYVRSFKTATEAIKFSNTYVPVVKSFKNEIEQQMNKNTQEG